MLNPFDLLPRDAVIPLLVGCAIAAGLLAFWRTDPPT